ncbi:hypothetical protein N7535_000090 [Penicillium sp. DV-2018c]|nr:hypothetical protein N7535_000090 [Penicillium sp. DV-2018c]
MDASTGPGVHSDVASENKEVQIASFKENALKSLKYSNVGSSLGASNSQIASQRRILSANDTRISVWRLTPLELYAEIEGIEPGALATDFGADENEVLVFHAWHTKLSIHSLGTGRSSVIKSPKFAHHLGFGYRPNTRELAILLKPETSDLLTVHEPRSYDLINRTVLPTIDAQGLKWSPDGKWIVIWDIASAGTKVLIFTADGQLFRTYSGPSSVDDTFDLGVKQVEWSPVSNQRTSEILAFSSATTLSHVFQTYQQGPSIWRERYTSAAGDADYTEASCSSALSMSPESSGSPRGVLTMSFSSDGCFLASVDTSRQNVVWIWSLDGTPSLASVLVHEQPVRQIAWNPSTPQLLINAVTNALPAIRWWSPQHHPLIARVPVQRSENGKYDVKWATGSNGDPTFWFGSTEEYVIGYLAAQDGGAKFEVLNSISSSVR